MTNKLANRQVHRITLIHFTAAGGEQGNRKGGKREKKKSRHPAEERPNYKSLNCNQKGDVPSATASVLFHCSFSRWQLVPPQNKTARWWRNVASKQGVCMETFMRMSRFRLDFHEPWHFMFVGTGLEDRHDERIEAPGYSALYFSFPNNFFWLHRWNCWSWCLFISLRAGEALRTANGKAGAFHWGKWWQPRCCETQIRTTDRSSELDSGSDNINITTGVRDFHLWEIIHHSHEYQSHRGWSINSRPR